MKILELRHLRDNDTPQLLLSPDSAANLPGRPVFLPDISQNWRCDIEAAWVIQRLGKNISSRFSNRYCSEMMLVARMVPLDIVQNETTEIWPAWATTFDGAIAMGQRIEVANTLAIAVTSPIAAQIELSDDCYPKAIQQLSRYIMLKTGDIIIPGPPIVSFAVVPDTHIEATLNGTTSLSFNIK